MTQWKHINQANEQLAMNTSFVKLKQDSFKGKRAVIIGSGVAGLTTAYELLAQKTGMEIIILEARDRTGGRCLSLRNGDSFVEDLDNSLFNSPTGERQHVHFERPKGDAIPYLNAGPGRIPSSHTFLLSYLQKFGVDLEVYIMNSSSNLTQLNNGEFDNEPIVNRRLKHDTRGWISQMVYQRATELIADVLGDKTKEEQKKLATLLQNLMRKFGALNEEGEFVPVSLQNGLDITNTRAGYSVLPQVTEGIQEEILDLDTLLKSEFWSKVDFYQSENFLWQPTLFQPVGGMDRVQNIFAQKIYSLGGKIYLNSPVTKVDWDHCKKQFIISYEDEKQNACDIVADYCFSNMAIPFLKKILSDDLQDCSTEQGFDEEFTLGLQAVYNAQFAPVTPVADDGFQSLFLAHTCKVGWQAKRSLWQKSTPPQDRDFSNNFSSEVGVVPIFGGISRTDNIITQIWYPSDDYNGELGVLTGTYNFREAAYEMALLSPKERLELARNQASLFGKSFGEGLKNGITIAWQNMPYIKGGWAQWFNVCDNVRFFNRLIQGATAGNGENPNFFIVGDQLSSLPGWQEGAVASGLNAIKRLAEPKVSLAYYSYIPDTRLIVENI